MKPLLLAPAGSFEALTAALDAGADEIYLGGTAFNARMNASNLDFSALEEAGALCRSKNVGLHITLNTLLFDREFSEMLRYVDFLSQKVMPDALIVQDQGVAAVLKREFPLLCLHASTQMRIHSGLDVPYLRQLGFSRGVLARELPKEDIKEFAKAGLETEIFVHGALCVSESGGCLMSHVIGDRSGNRGKCAQPCRLPCKGNTRYPLSLKDLCLAERITEISELGVTSLKLEGRMKSPEYVAAVTSVYRTLLDEGRNATGEELQYLKDVFSRDGFTSGYFDSRIGKSMFGFRKGSDKEKTASLVPRKTKTHTEVRHRSVAPAIPESIPEFDKSTLLHPKHQLGTVLRFEGKLPSSEFFGRFGEDAVRIDVPAELADARVLEPIVSKLAIILPRQCYASERGKLKKMILAAKKRGIKHAVVSAFWHIDFCEGMYLHGDYPFNIVNNEALNRYCRFPFSSLMLSPESDPSDFHGAPTALEYIVYGRTPVMYTRNCIIKNISGCADQSRCFGTLTDRTGAKFPIIGGFGHRNTIYNSLPSNRIDSRKKLKKSGIGLTTLLFTAETEARMAEICGRVFGK